MNNEEKNNEEKNVVDSLSLESQVKKLTLEVNDLRYKIKGLENDLDDMSQEIEDANKVRQAVVEIQEFLTKKANGYDVNFHSYLIRLNK
jgi:septal ring factor EnvC (AmiA/AmiB activator)|tara:strand:- start:911 stop:1177 length:267 start_codon:yes stop_codon:yes gene_type:complete